MIEAVNSAIANSVLVRGNVEQGASTRASSAATVAASEPREMVLAPYISPFVYVDNQFNKAVLQIRDSDTGEVQRQFPSEQTLAARAAAQDAVEDSQILDRGLSNNINVSGPAQTTQSSTLFAASQMGAAAPAPAPSAPSSLGGVNIAQAQMAAAALSSASFSVSSGSTVNTSA